jgi:DNA-binding FadR family transcriptional regulator
MSGNKPETNGRRPTMSDVARAAGCSQSTVSFVLSRKPGARITAATRRRVEEAAQALGYEVRSGGEPARRRRDAAAAGQRFLTPSDSQTGKVVREIGMAIVSGHFPVDSVLPRDAELMARYGVSRTVLREALKTLSGKQLLQPRPRIGTRVRHRNEWNLFDPDLLMWHGEAGLDAGFIQYVEEIRWALEPEAAALAARRHTKQGVATLHRHVDRMAAADGSAREFIDADLDLHLAIADMAGNPFMRAISALIEFALVAALAKSSPGNEIGGAARSAAKHRDIVTAISAGDEETARTAMRVVIAEGIARAARR